MKKDLDILKTHEVPEHLDVAVLSAAKFAAYRKNKQQKIKRLFLAAGSIAAAFAVGFSIFSVSEPKSKYTDSQYSALNDLSAIEQEAFALAAELNCRSIYALDYQTGLENQP